VGLKEKDGGDWNSETSFHPDRKAGEKESLDYLKVEFEDNHNTREEGEDRDINQKGKGENQKRW